eukprot:1805363-Karenia_brevis.AAC.1
MSSLPEEVLLQPLALTPSAHQATAAYVSTAKLVRAVKSMEHGGIPTHSIHQEYFAIVPFRNVGTIL